MLNLIFAVLIAWSQNTEKDLAGYVVRAGNTQITVTNNSHLFDNESYSGQITVSAFDKNNNYSAPSNPVRLNVDSLGKVLELKYFDCKYKVKILKNPGSSVNVRFKTSGVDTLIRNVTNEFYVKTLPEMNWKAAEVTFYFFSQDCTSCTITKKSILIPSWGDLNADGKIDLKDRIIIGGLVNSYKGEENYRSDADFNFSNSNNLADVIYLKKRIGLKYEN